LEDDEDLLLGGVAVRDAAPVARRDLLPVKAGERRAFARREGRGGHQAFVLLVLDLVDVDDVPGPRRRLADRERLDGRLDLPRVVVAPLYPAPAEPDCAGPRQPAQLRRMARAEDEVLEPIWPRDECVLHLIRAVDDAVEWSHLVHTAGLPCEPRAGEDEKQLLGRAVRVGRRRQPAGSDADAVDADDACAVAVYELVFLVTEEDRRMARRVVALTDDRDALAAELELRLHLPDTLVRLPKRRFVCRAFFHTVSISGATPDTPRDRLG